MEIEGIILVRPQNPKNVGTIVRTMATFGIENLIIVHNEEKFGKIIYSREIKKVASGGVHILENTKRANSLSEIKGRKVGAISIYDNKRYDFELIPITELPKINGKYYLVFGSENKGLSKEELELCDLVSTIPTNDKYGVLNLGISAVLYIYEIYKTRFLSLIYENYK